MVASGVSAYRNISSSTTRPPPTSAAAATSSQSQIDSVSHPPSGPVSGGGARCRILTSALVSFQGVTSWSQLQGSQQWAGDGTRRSRSSRH